MLWVQSMQEPLPELINIDGKTLCRSFDKANSQSAFCFFASECRLVLAQGKADEKANEITVIRTLLHLLAIKGASITIAAMGCQKDIAQIIIIEKGKLCLGA